MQNDATSRRAGRLRRLIATGGAAMMAIALAPAAIAGNDVTAVPETSDWRNPANTVHVRLRACGGDRMCGTVIWASAKAQADARRGGTEKLIGANLFRDFRRVGPGRYQGRVFVPDINRTFAGQMRVEGDSMIGKGCVLAGLICKQQVWKRIS
jgi:uncharacterized protein (DUF2147 family)